MSTAELKEEIEKAVKQIPESAPESVLQEALGYIQDISNKIAERAKRAEYVKEIIAEDEEVFRKLAQ
ncbi:hypothetical protein [Mucilaginibacter psychrotolerans]|uniref:Uncharacterized protein n=1 Tax=Mucilaginibacter psychrotolerans TaxID=1524096 RepID=A0A4Y8SBH6_9SPHI|nr:hypothetical protein [Mucilaginibacter psychrotolerans]TFF35937.1 hypothetical protein E2R66_17110 [Mucilaginibacter psychrotolerans]